MFWNITTVFACICFHYICQGGQEKNPHRTYSGFRIKQSSWCLKWFQNLVLPSFVHSDKTPSIYFQVCINFILVADLYSFFFFLKFSFRCNNEGILQTLKTCIVLLPVEGLSCCFYLNTFTLAVLLCSFIIRLEHNASINTWPQQSFK